MSPRSDDDAAVPGGRRVSTHHAVVVSTSKYWFNYRHAANALEIYRTLRRLGLGDSQIVLMLADNIPCDARNAFPGQIFTTEDRRRDLFSGSYPAEVDYAGDDVTRENFVRILTDRLGPEIPLSRRLRSTSDSKLLIFMTGHGGDGFLKFQDENEILATDLAWAFADMRSSGRYDEILLMTDTCEAHTIANDIDYVKSPNVHVVSSSLLGENSYAHHADTALGVAVIDRFTRATVQYIEGENSAGARKGPDATIGDLVRSYARVTLGANVGHTSPPGVSADAVRISDFFADSTV
eukprot:CAMPEP_0194315042 /NCGR_PEP_ID=MMETSP0171-20130528/11849_1 /TAXON_ID=218684 /ORGANISM="Corethron pennatum, Strain L29A3" /LENGTH=293 /DNA_ID=CAMNT_0039070691 /DNA_START=105 /DNA_END=982 /DNA_ORIENTATION=+